MHTPSVAVLDCGVQADLDPRSLRHVFIPVHPDMMLTVGQVRTWRVSGTSLFGWFATHYEAGKDADWVGYLPIDHLMPMQVQ